jgi:hypothetical protein
MWCNAIGLAGWCTNMNVPHESVRVCASHTVQAATTSNRKQAAEEAIPGQRALDERLRHESRKRAA